MSKRDRYFIDRGGPFLQALRRIREERKAASSVLLKFVEEIGASKMYGTTPASYLFDFNRDSDADPKVWSKTKPRRGEYYFRPRRNTPEGKAMAARIKALPECPSFDDAIESIPGLRRFPIVTEGNRWFAPYLRFMPSGDSFAIAVVPWKDYSAEEIDSYRKEREAGTHYSASLDFAQWTPPDWLQELKEWEALKIIDEHSAKKSAA
jgi:hypothetical protein